MAEETQSQPVILRFSGGLDNRSIETELSDGTLRVCENLDVTRSGSLLSRLGLRSVSAGSYHSSYTPSHGRFILLVKNGTLGILSGDESFSSLVSLIQNAPVNYAELNGDVFWTTPYQRGRVDYSGAAGYWGLNTPFFVSAAAAASGGLYAGDYQVTLTSAYQGLESGAPATTVVSVPDGGGVSVTVPAGGTFNIYLSTANGTAIELRQAATVTATLLDSDGEEVEGVTWPVTLEYVEESDGKYQGILDDAIELVDKEIYTLVVDSVDGESKGHWELAVQARTRTKWA